MLLICCWFSIWIQFTIKTPTRYLIKCFFLKFSFHNFSLLEFLNYEPQNISQCNTVICLPFFIWAHFYVTWIRLCTWSCLYSFFKCQLPHQSAILRGKKQEKVVYLNQKGKIFFFLFSIPSENYIIKSYTMHWRMKSKHIQQKYIIIC